MGIWPECEPLMLSHRQEVDPEGSARLSWEPRPDYYEALDSMGLFVGITARTYSDNRLIGYCIWTLGPSMDSPGLTASQGPWFVEPAFRRGPLGLRLFIRALEAVRESGAIRAFPHHWASDNAGALARYFRKIGAKPIETTYSLWLGE